MHRRPWCSLLLFSIFAHIFTLVLQFPSGPRGELQCMLVQFCMFNHFWGWFYGVLCIYNAGVTPSHLFMATHIIASSPSVKMERLVLHTMPHCLCLVDAGGLKACRADETTVCVNSITGYS